MQRKLIEHLASAIVARANCARDGNDRWFQIHTESVATLAREFLPSGAGIDSGCSVDLDRSREHRLVINTSFHHMNDHGFYDGWTDHVITVQPSFTGLDLRISGRDRNGIKDYLFDAFRSALEQPVVHDESGFRLVVELPEPTESRERCAS